MINFEEVPSNPIVNEENTKDYEYVNTIINTEYCFKNSLIDFHEGYDYYDDEKTIFAYTEMRRFYM